MRAWRAMLAVAAVLFVLVLAVLGGGLWSDLGGLLPRPAFRAPVSDYTRGGLDRPTHTRTVLLFFADAGRQVLVEELREVEAGATLTEEAKRALEELVKGPEGDLRGTIPRATQVRNLFIDASGTAYVDFDRQLRDGHSGVAQEELFTVYSIVDTLTANFPQIKRVQILVDGTEIESLKGHVDTRAPLEPRFVFGGEASA